MSMGTVYSVGDIVVRVQFDESSPEVGEILVIDNKNTTKLLVDHLEPAGLAVCLNVRADRTIQKGMSVKRTEPSLILWHEALKCWLLA